MKTLSQNEVTETDLGEYQPTSQEDERYIFANYIMTVYAGALAEEMFTRGWKPSQVNELVALVTERAERKFLEYADVQKSDRD